MEFVSEVAVCRKFVVVHGWKISFVDLVHCPLYYLFVWAVHDLWKSFGYFSQIDQSPANRLLDQPQI